MTARIIIVFLMSSIEELAARMLQLKAGVVSSIQRATRAEQALQNVMGQVGQLQAAATAPQAQRQQPPPPPHAFVGTRQLGKPKSFNGNDSAWHGFRFLLSVYAGAVEPILASLMASAPGVAEDDVVNARLNTEERRLSVQLYYMLGLSIDQDIGALTIVELGGGS